MFEYFKTKSSKENAKSPTKSQKSEVSDDESEMVAEVEENERFLLKHKSWKPEFLLPSDPKRFKTSVGQFDEFPDLPLADGWEYDGPWEVDTDMENCALDGWVYNTTFLELDLGHFQKQTNKSVCRRKRWIRQVVQSAPLVVDAVADVDVAGDAVNTSNNAITTVDQDNLSVSSSGDDSDGQSDVSDDEAVNAAYNDQSDSQLNGSALVRNGSGLANLVISENINVPPIHSINSLRTITPDQTKGTSFSSSSSSGFQQAGSLPRTTSGIAEQTPTKSVKEQPSVIHDSPLSTTSGTNGNLTNRSSYNAGSSTVSEGGARKFSNAPPMSPPQPPLNNTSNYRTSDADVMAPTSSTKTPIVESYTSNYFSNDTSKSNNATANLSSLQGTFHDEDGVCINDLNAFEVEYDDDAKSVAGYSEMGDLCGQQGGGGGGGSVNGDQNRDYSPQHSTSSGRITSVKSQQPSPAAAAPRRTSYFGFGGGSKAPVATVTNSALAPPPQKNDPHLDPLLRVIDPVLLAIGRQMKLMEAECKKADEEGVKLWKKDTKPRLEAQIADLEKVCNALKARIETEVSRGTAHINALEEELRQFLEKQDEHKKALYFPLSVFTLGQGGVYIGLDDVWIEHVSGYTSLELLPDKQLPQIEVVLSGTKDNAAEGFKLRLKAEGFKLAGDKGMNVPKINFDNLKITIALNVRMSLTFDSKTQKWLCPPKSFRIEVLSFKGPYGINRSMVGMVLSLVSPMIRKQMLNNLPHELGLMMRTMPSPFTARGEFHIVGTDLTLLATELHKTSIMPVLCGYTQQQVSMFYWLQKALDRSTSLKTISDIIMYRRALVKHTDKWAAISNLWSQAAKIYSEKVITMKLAQLQVMSMSTRDMAALSIRSETFFKACDDLMKKRLCASYQLEYVDGQMSLNHVLSFTHQLLFRFANEAINTANALQKIRLLSLIDRLTVSNRVGKENLKLISKNIDFAQLTIQLKLHAGPQGELSVTVKDILAQAPVLLKLSIAQELNIGALPLVPYIITMKPSDNGDIGLEIYHFCHDAARIRALEQQHSAAKSFANGGSSGNFSTSYNKVMNSITANKAANAAAAQTRERSNSMASTVSSYHQTNTANTAHRGDSPNNLRSASSFYGSSSVAHLLVKHEQMQLDLEETLKASPQGDEADSILEVVATSPHISMIVDKAITLKPGAELFTMVVGPQSKGWKPFGTVNRFEEPDEPDEDDDSPLSTPAAVVDLKAPVIPVTIAGCPVMMQTAPGIKMLTQVPKADVKINLPGLVRFVLAHFTDLPLLKDYLESFCGGEFFEEQLLTAKQIIDKLAKYLLLPGLDIEINLNGKIVAMGSEIMVRIETPEEITEQFMDRQHSRGSSDEPSGQPGDSPTCAIKFRAELNLQDLFNDSLDIESYVKKSQTTGDSAAGTGTSKV